MRVGIDYRLLASRENLVNRGIGRYTQQQLRHVLKLDTESEYVLLCPPQADLSLVLPEIRAAANVSMCSCPPSAGPAPADPYDRRGLLRRAAEYQDWIHGLGIDLYHATAPFVLEQTAPPAFDACPMVATVYDFIPLIFPSAYLGDGGPRAAYAGAARMVRTARRLIAISDGTREDAVHYLGFPREAIDCAWPFADACFAPMAGNQVTNALRPVRDRVALPDRFVLTVAALHHTKNLELLFGAYARLSASFRRSLPLVVSCHLDEVGAAHVRRWADTFGVADDIVLTGYVPDPQLAALYNSATLVVHPSRYEGFGLPVVEAMQCGAAVVTTTAPSLPEVTEGAAALVDPDDATGLAAAIEGLSRDADERERMGQAGMTRAAAFTPEALARETLSSYRAALDSGSASSSGSATRVAVCSPFRPSVGEAAEHGLDLLRALPRRWDVEVFTDDADGPLPDELLDAFPVHHRSALARCDGRRPFDRVVHNISPGTDLPPFEHHGRPAVIVVHSDADKERFRQAEPDAAVVVAPLVGIDPPRGRQQLDSRMPVRGFNRLCQAEDFDDPSLIDALAEMGLGTAAGTVALATAMSLRALAEFDLLGPSRRVLVLGMPGAPAAFRLTRDVGEVTLAGPWLDMGGTSSSRALLVDPGLVATVPFKQGPLVVRHADLRRLPFPDDAFEAVLACRAVDGFTPDGVGRAVAEMARVVKPGGMVALSVPVRLHGPASSSGIPIDWIVTDLVPSSGLVPVDAVRVTLSDDTLTSRRLFSAAFGPSPIDGDQPLTVSGGAVLGCLQLILRKG